MPQRLPSLVALRAFEAAARLESFTRVGEELNVTQAAVSHQVKQLERAIGVALFRRYPRGLSLTEDGVALQETVGQAFSAISDRVVELRDRIGVGALTIGLTPYFSALWLSRRLWRFWRWRPGIHLHLLHAIRPTDFRANRADMAIAWGDGDWPGLETLPLLRSKVSPVCSPALQEWAGGLREPADLARVPLLHDVNYAGWTRWLEAVGAESVDPRQGPTMDDPNVVLHAVIDGQGVALGVDALIKDDIAAGRLVRPFDVSVATGASYYIVYPPGALERPKVHAFATWILLETGLDEAAVRDRIGG